MRPLYIFVLAALLPLSSPAQEAAAATDEASALPAPEVFAPVDAANVALDELLYLKRPVVVFADSPNDPNFVRQMQLLQRDLPELAERDVILIVDTDPDARSEVRQRLRPRGFSLVLMDKDLKPIIRKPLPWDVREITHAIDKFPLRRQEMLERNPAGR